MKQRKKKPATKSKMGRPEVEHPRRLTIGCAVSERDMEILREANYKDWLYDTIMTAAKRRLRK